MASKVLRSDGGVFMVIPSRRLFVGFYDKPLSMFVGLLSILNNALCLICVVSIENEVRLG